MSDAARERIAEIVARALGEQDRWARNDPDQPDEPDSDAVAARIFDKVFVEGGWLIQMSDGTYSLTAVDPGKSKVPRVTLYAVRSTEEKT